MALILSLAICLFAVSAELNECPVFSCSSNIATGKCAEKNSNNVLISSTGCSAGTSCSLTSIKEWYGVIRQTLATKALLSCGVFDEKTYLTFEEGDVECGTQPIGHDLKDGSHPKSCTTSEDCTTADGVEGTCACGLNGGYYCKPKLGSSYWGSYWSECKANDDEIDSGRYFYWQYRMAQHEFLALDFEDSMTCLQQLSEWKVSNQLNMGTRYDQDDEDWAGILYAGLAVVLLTIL